MYVLVCHCFVFADDAAVPPYITDRSPNVIEEGMVFSDGIPWQYIRDYTVYLCRCLEPGHYVEGSFGIRIESDLVVERADTQDAHSEHPVLKLEFLTLVPFERSLINVSLLNDDEIELINQYHLHCFDQLSAVMHHSERVLSEEAIRWLTYQCEPLSSSI